MARSHFCCAAALAALLIAAALSAPAAAARPMRAPQGQQPPGEPRMLQDRRQLGETAAAAAASAQRAHDAAGSDAANLPVFAAAAEAADGEARDQFGIRPGHGGVFMMYDEAKGHYPEIAHQQRDFDDIGCCSDAIPSVPGIHQRITVDGGVYQTTGRR